MDDHEQRAARTQLRNRAIAMRSMEQRLRGGKGSFSAVARDTRQLLADCATSAGRRVIGVPFSAIEPSCQCRLEAALASRAW